MNKKVFLGNLEGDLELADKIVKEGSEWQQERRKKFVNLIDWVEQEFLEDDFSDTTDENIEMLNGLVGGNFERIKTCLENDLTTLLGIIGNKINSDIDIIPDNSFRDILGNLNVGYLSSYKRVLSNLNDNVAIKNARQTLAERFVELFVFLDYYIVELITDTKEEVRKSKNKLKAELELRDGYVGKFKKYLTKQCPISNPNIRLALFYFFSKLEKGYFRRSKYKNTLERFWEDTKSVVVYNGRKGVAQFLDMNKIENDFIGLLS